MDEARARILAGIRRSLGRDGLAPADEAALRSRMASRSTNLVPARAVQLDRAARLALFAKMAEEADATVSRLAVPQAVPGAVAGYLSDQNLPARLVMAPDPELDRIPWQYWPLLQIRRGRAEADDLISLTPCFAAIAETGTLMLRSGPHTPTTLNFLPDTHIVLVYADQIVATYEEGWVRLRQAANAAGGLPRTVNFVTGPSRTGDIEQRIVLGAHGPRRLHILLVENRQSDER